MRLVRFMIPVIVILAPVFGLMLVPFACSGGAQSTGSTFVGTFSACAKANLAQIVGGAQGQTLFEDVLTRIKGNSPTLVADLDGLALTVGVDAVECAVAAVIAALTPTAVAVGSGSNASTTAAELPGVVKAKAWIASRQKAGAP